jgi:hypothetical protein
MQPSVSVVGDRAPLVELNTACLERLRSAATAAGEAHHPLVRNLRAEWAGLREPALSRLASLPFTLLDGDLRAVLESASRPLGVQDAAPRSGHACFDRATGQALLRRVLFYGWHLARAQPRTARLALGCDGTTVALLAASSLATLDLAAEVHGHDLGVRWVHDTEFWSRLLQLARAPAAAAFDEAALHAIRRVAAGALQPQR